jgi:hypothetical protein
MNFFWVLLDLIFLASAGFTVYRQSKITLHARYNYFALGYGVIFGFMLVMYSVPGFTYMVMVALFILLNVMSGVGGLAEDRVITNGIFYGVTVRYSDLAAVTLTSRPMPGEKHFIIAIFTLKRNGRNIRLNFSQSLETLVTDLRQNLPSEVALVVR